MGPAKGLFSMRRESCRVKQGRKRGKDVVRVEDKETRVETHGVYLVYAFHVHK